MLTKQRIQDEALTLFSQKGFDATSMSDIAEAVGITKGALYRHYAGKQEILDSILKRMEEDDRLQSETDQVPTESASVSPESYTGVDYEHLLSFTRTKFRYWTEDSFDCRFRRLVTIERYHTETMASLYHQYLLDGVIAYLEDIFRERYGASALVMAYEFYAPVLLLMDQKNGLTLLEAHLDYWRKTWNTHAV